MANAHFVKSARKDYPDDGIKKGESYWWWAFMVGGRGGAKHRSKTQPKPSQLTQSEFMSTVLSVEEDLGAATSDMTNDELNTLVEDARSELETLRDETQEKFDNMPDGLQQGDTGQLLEGRVESVDEMISDLEQLNLEPENDDERQSLVVDIQNISYGGE